MHGKPEPFREEGKIPTKEQREHTWERSGQWRPRPGQEEHTLDFEKPLPTLTHQRDTWPGPPRNEAGQWRRRVDG